MKKFIHTAFNRPIEPTANAIREHFKTSSGITLYGLEKDAVDSLLNKFPKYTKVKSSTCTSRVSFLEHGIHSEKLSEGDQQVHKTYGISLSVSPVNGVTGDLNETGQKRIEKFISILQREGYIS
ncbi:hypothetical protein [Bacillus safensis]|uniref:hypothetical protein n=1 Tax=Bacillus safensis TaxID=561879 RepID=UPI002E23DB7B|nr:hypothetical protein [Bacillus safensis]